MNKSRMTLETAAKIYYAEDESVEGYEEAVQMVKKHNNMVDGVKAFEALCFELDSELPSYDFF